MIVSQEWFTPDEAMVRVSRVEGQGYLSFDDAEGDDARGDCGGRGVSRVGCPYSREAASFAKAGYYYVRGASAKAGSLGLIF